MDRTYLKWGLIIGIIAILIYTYKPNIIEGVDSNTKLMTWVDENSAYSSQEFTKGWDRIVVCNKMPSSGKPFPSQQYIDEAKTNLSQGGDIFIGFGGADVSASPYNTDGSWMQEFKTLLEKNNTINSKLIKGIDYDIEGTALTRANIPNILRNHFTDPDTNQLECILTILPTWKETGETIVKNIMSTVPEHKDKIKICLMLYGGSMTSKDWTPNYRTELYNNWKNSDIDVFLALTNVYTDGKYGSCIPDNDPNFEIYTSNSLSYIGVWSGAPGWSSLQQQLNILNRKFLERK